MEGLFTPVFFAGVAAAAISGAVFSIISNRLGYAKKIVSKIKNRNHKIVFLVLVVAITGVVSAVTGIVASDIFENEMLAAILQWSVFGAFMPFMVEIVFSIKGLL
ncbi:MAG: hypothetical protein FWG63_08775 [Defluviitaleaceae bacterium]|nr:hypothetical protein [Defluviitaleaceae bacterium]